MQPASSSPRESHHLVLPGCIWMRPRALFQRLCHAVKHAVEATGNVLLCQGAGSGMQDAVAQPTNKIHESRLAYCLHRSRMNANLATEEARARSEADARLSTPSPHRSAATIRFTGRHCMPATRRDAKDPSSPRLFKTSSGFPSGLRIAAGSLAAPMSCPKLPSGRERPFGGLGGAAWFCSKIVRFWTCACAAGRQN